MKNYSHVTARKLLLSVAAIGVFLSEARLARADSRLCQANSGNNRGKVTAVTVPDTCPANSTQILYQADLFGSGTSNLRVAAGTTRSIGAYEQSYNNCTIAAGATLNVPSGSIIRCNGDFTNNGFVTVGTMARGGTRVATELSSFELEGNSASPNIGGLVARHGLVASTTTDEVQGGSFGNSALPATAYFFPGPIGGGGGGAGIARQRGSSSYAGQGGGTAVILVRGNFENSGVISANGADSIAAGGGGGGGGVIVIGVKGTLVNSATISAHGGAGGAGEVNESSTPLFAVGGGGGGSGGFVHLVAARLTVENGIIDVTGGTGGLGTGTASGAVSLRIGGGAGGPGVGYGGGGGDIAASGVISSGQSGFAGLSRSTTSNNIEKLFGFR